MQPTRMKAKRINRGIPVIVFFIITMLFSLVCVSLVTGYLYSEFLYSEYMSDIMNQAVDTRGKFIFHSSLIFGGAWVVVFAFIFIVGSYIHNKFSRLISIANKIGEGQYNFIIVKNGPREVRDLAFALERIKKRLEGGQ